ncbi:hypothetical protein ORQ98_24210 [Spartinivicinus sp. A2-2]|uniref:Uncharacterized protein n=2 Tax=Spartinivicinus poritis TaxID=2994640 RepID=A0ABT5UFB0_9GAMM|nr:hypothetical protein [Spartinivicinus sp. A2-2]
MGYDAINEIQQKASMTNDYQDINASLPPMNSRVDVICRYHDRDELITEKIRAYHDNGGEFYLTTVGHNISKLVTHWKLAG